MGFLSTTEFNSLEDLFFHQIEDLYDAEKRLSRALPEMAGAAGDPELKAAFEHHLQETEGQANRLERIFKEHGREPKRETCEAMKGLISEGQTMVDAKGDSAVRDAALIAAAQRVEHYEIAGYGTARTFAQKLGWHDAVQLLQETLEEEKHADEKLTQVAESRVNIHAAV